MFHVEHQLTYSEYPSNEIDLIKQLYSDNKQSLSEYIDQLLWWNKKVNLVSRDVSRETLQNHVEHSLVVAGSQLFQQAQKIVDAGSGGGLPGIPLGIAFPEKKIVLNDIVSKKMMACRQMVRKLGLPNVIAQDGSIAKIESGAGDLIISKHAFKINDLIELLDDKEWSGILLLKGGDEVKEELEGIQEQLKIDIIKLESLGNSFYDGKALVEITKK